MTRRGAQVTLGETGRRKTAAKRPKPFAIAGNVGNFIAARTVQTSPQPST